MSERPEVLSSAAGSVSDGTLVEWERLAQQMPAEDQPFVEALRQLERIARFHRTESDEPPLHAVEKPVAVPRTWAYFTILERIGGGAFGDVYLAHDTKLQRDVALKLIRRNAYTSPHLSQVLKEARLLARVRHTNVVHVYGADQTDGDVGLWMELVRGKTFEELLQQQGTFGAREAANVGLDLCRAVAAVHRAGLIHGDIKTHNVMREEGGRTVLMDFGAGKKIDRNRLMRDEGGARDISGTPLYLAPEVFAGSPRTEAADVYSIGVLLFHLATNTYPVEAKTIRQIEEAHKESARIHLRDLRPDLPDTFVNLVERALHADPAQRFRSAGAFEIALATMLGAPVEPVEPVENKVRRTRTGSLAAACIAAGLAIGMPVYWTATHLRSPLPAVSSAAAPSRPVTEPPTAAAGTYHIDAGLYRVSDAGEARLRPGDRIAPGDRLSLHLQVSQPTHVYVVDEDDSGASFLLFPLPDQAIRNPIPASQSVRLPAGGDAALYWRVTSAGGREHFLIFATPEPLPTLDRMFASLPPPQVNAPLLAAPLSSDAVGLLRGVGGLSTSSRDNPGKLAEQFTTALPEAGDLANGLWVRQITLENPR